MICCDKCEEWFHGKCVGITRQMGREMEQRQSEWICPNCEKKQQPSIKVSYRAVVFLISQTSEVKSDHFNCFVCISFFKFCVLEHFSAKITIGQSFNQNERGIQI